MPPHHLPADGGLIYTETNVDHFFPEPLNMVTSALFLIPALYWLIRLKGFDKRYIFLSIATYFLLTACIGSTVYHGLRRWAFFIYMDWLPIAALCLLASGYFWYKVLGKWYYGVLAFAAFIATVFGIRTFMPVQNLQLSISLNYGVMGLMIVLPLFLLLSRMQWRGVGLVLTALLAFATALFFRVADQWAWVSFGTHFLWHFFGCGATSAIFLFIYRLKDLPSLALR
ncbi:hypothetical protein [Mucilaginibacter myungsuensis]|uniref:Hemolysin III n=1 Tax=Mucilaginibacter myungsuensis TaxID=649104 RepID=A0A929L5D6_9SPHI|nr:hypothetical protein [Mucilaginibacter myungsuensis]MBE9664305.1 hypothetical protein [Mucilaginibacter myungsuensis]MDN3597014.1 hypothetical protein [Mucilaginibacter myungsuensis]